MNYTKLIISLAVCFSVAFAATLITTPAIAIWYESLNKPDFTPPNWVFGPVWLSLYLLMGISLYLVWAKEKANKKVLSGLTLFSLQLLLNLFWTQTFFGLQSPVLGLFVVVILWFSLAFTIMSFKAISKTASLLLIPYLVWVSFAMILNGAIVILN